MRTCDGLFDVVRVDIVDEGFGDFGSGRRRGDRCRCNGVGGPAEGVAGRVQFGCRALRVGAGEAVARQQSSGRESVAQAGDLCGFTGSGGASDAEGEVAGARMR